jgi:hypothetical protein
MIVENLFKEGSMKPLPDLRRALVDATPPKEREGALRAVRQVLEDLRGAVPPPAPPALSQACLSSLSSEDDDSDK